MDKKTTDIVAYCTWIGFIVAICAGNREESKFHLNQAIVLHLFSLLGIIPIIGWLWGLFMIACMVLGIINAANGEEKEVPLLGSITILK